MSLKNFACLSAHAFIAALALSQSSPSCLKCASVFGSSNHSLTGAIRLSLKKAPTPSISLAMVSISKYCARSVSIPRIFFMVQSNALAGNCRRPEMIPAIADSIISFIPAPFPNISLYFLRPAIASKKTNKGNRTLLPIHLDILNRPIRYLFFPRKVKTLVIILIGAVTILRNLLLAIHLATPLKENISLRAGTNTAKTPLINLSGARRTFPNVVAKPTNSPVMIAKGARRIPTKSSTILAHMPLSFFSISLISSSLSSCFCFRSASAISLPFSKY